MLHAKAQAMINAVVWIMSPDDDDERQSTEQVLTFLEPFLQAMNIPLLKFEPKSAAELSQFLSALENKAKAGLRPIIHLDTHGGQTDGLYVAASDEFVSWRELADQLRPINVAAQNNVCLVSAACFSMHTIMNIEIKAATPFLLMFAPQHTVTFGFVEKKMFDFYDDVFTSHDIMGAHERHLAPVFQQYHCQRLLLKSLSAYMRDSCTGKGRRKRAWALVKKSLGAGRPYPDTPEYRRIARRIVLTLTKPNQRLVDRYVGPFLMDQGFSISFEEILNFVRADAVRRNVLARRAARTRRRNRGVQNARRKHLRALKRR